MIAYHLTRILAVCMLMYCAWSLDIWLYCGVMISASLLDFSEVLKP